MWAWAEKYPQTKPNQIKQPIVYRKMKKRSVVHKIDSIGVQWKYVKQEGVFFLECLEVGQQSDATFQLATPLESLYTARAGSVELQRTRTYNSISQRYYNGY